MPQKLLKVWMVSSYLGNEEILYSEEFKKLEEEFDIKIELTMLPWSNFFECLVEAFRNGNSPDVFQLGTSWVNTLAYMDYLAPIPFTPNLKPALADWMDHCCHYNGVRIAVPWIADTVLLAARQDILDKHGIKPSDLADWDGFYKVCAELAEERRLKPNTSNNPAPLGFSVKPELGTLHWFIAWLWSGGWEFPALDPIPQKILQHTSSIKTLAYIASLVDISGITANDLQIHPQNLFEQFYSYGKYVFYMGNWYSLITNFTKSQHIKKHTRTIENISYTLLPMPSSSSCPKPWGGGSVMAISAKSNSPELAGKIINHMLSESFVLERIALNGNLPSFETDFWSKYRDDERIQLVRNQFSKSSAFPQHPLWRTIERILCEGVSNALWRVINEKIPVSDETIVNIFKETDQGVANTLGIAWEMNKSV